MSMNHTVLHFHHLSCSPRKVIQRMAPATILVRHARSSSVRFENSPCGLRQFETLNPRTRSPDGNGRMGKVKNFFSQAPHISRRELMKNYKPYLTLTRAGLSSFARVLQRQEACSPSWNTGAALHAALSVFFPRLRRFRAEPGAGTEHRRQMERTRSVLSLPGR